MSALVTEHLPLLATAPEGIKKLRGLILELAVRGKLVPQDPNDEPAGKLLKQIAEEKARLTAEGKIKKQKDVGDLASEDHFFDLPENWVWTRVGAVLTRISNGYSGAQGKMPTAHRISRIETISRAEIDYSRVGYCVQIGDEDIERYSLLKGDILFSHINSDFHLGKTALYNAERPLMHGANLLLLRSSSNMVPGYINLYLTSLRMSGYFRRIAQHAIGQSSVNQAKVSSIPISLPPFTEQQRIVAKVDELMALCDRLEAQQDDAAAAHAQLVQTLLDSLTQAKGADDFAASWQRLSAHFDVLFTTEASIDALKQTILQLAVMGKLVPQDPSDEPASELLSRIAEEKKRLTAGGEIKKSKPSAPIAEDEKFLDIPAGWIGVRLESIAEVGTGATPLRTNLKYFDPPEFNWVTSGETDSDFIGVVGQKVSSLALSETNLTVYPPHTLIVAMYGQGKTRGQISELLVPACTNQACAAIRLLSSDESHRRYVKYFFVKSYEDIRQMAAGGAQPNLNLGKIKETVLPMPPIAEQNRIVAKVDELMALCDQLKMHLNSARQLHEKLAGALVEQAVA